jgi:hypothetical protein
MWYLYPVMAKSPANLTASYEEWFTRQGGLCALCGKPLHDERRFNHLDHSHEKNEMRGLLHQECNHAIGGFERALRVASMERIQAYLGFASWPTPLAKPINRIPFSPMEQYHCRMALKRARARHEIERLPCAVCGDFNSQAHHDDYTHPLDVVWLCAAHRLERLKRLGWR